MIYLPDIDDVFSVDQRFDLLLEVSSLLVIEGLSGQNDRHPSLVRYADRVQRRFPRSHAAQEREIFSRKWRKFVRVKVTSIVDHANTAAARLRYSGDLPRADRGNRSF